MSTLKMLLESIPVAHMFLWYCVIEPVIFTISYSRLYVSAAGICIVQVLSLEQGSSKATLLVPFSDNLLAKTQPAEPAPTIT